MAAKRKPLIDPGEPQAATPAGHWPPELLASAPIVWCQTESGGRIPVDAEPVADGNIEVAGITAMVLKKAQIETARQSGVPLHKSHFATCPSASRFRRKRK